MFMKSPDRQDQQGLKTKQALPLVLDDKLSNALRSAALPPCHAHHAEISAEPKNMSNEPPRLRNALFSSGPPARLDETPSVSKAEVKLREIQFDSVAGIDLTLKAREWQGVVN